MSNKDKVMHEMNMQQVSTTQKIMVALVKFCTYAFLLVMALIVLFPFYWMIISSLKTLDEYRLSVPTFWPKVVMLSNYAEAFTTANLGRLFYNTMIVGVISTLLSLVITVLSAFAFARLEFKGRETLFTLLLATFGAETKEISRLIQAMNINVVEKTGNKAKNYGIDESKAEELNGEVFKSRKTGDVVRKVFEKAQGSEEYKYSDSERMFMLNTLYESKPDGIEDFVDGFRSDLSYADQEEYFKEIMKLYANFSV